MRRLQVMASVLACLLFLALACSPRTGPSPAPATAPQVSPWGEWDKVVEAAQKEGEVNWYTAFISPPTRVAVRDAFMKKYGIKVEAISGTGPELGAKIDSEQRGKAYTADVFDTGTTTLILITKPAGYLEGPLILPETEKKGVWRVDPRAQDPDNYLFTYCSWCAYLLMNTNLVTPQDEPKSYADLLDPKWSGKILMFDPTVTGPGAKLFGLVVNRLGGVDYWREFAAKQKPKFIRDPKSEIDMVTQGEYPIALGIYAMMTISPIQKGAPLKLGWLKEGVPAMEYAMTLVKNAPHPNAAKVFIDWYLSQEGQTVFSQSAGIPSDRTDVSQDHLHPQFRWGPEVKFLPFTAEETRAAGKQMELAAEVFKIKK